MMTSNLNKWKLNRKIKGKFIVINDQKKLIPLFEGQYQKFLDRNKGTEINNKTDLIKLLNRKPRSFLTTLRLLVKTFKNYDNKVNYFMKKSIHPKLLAPATKANTKIVTTKNVSVVSLPSKEKKNKLLKVSQKIQELTTSLNNNTLSIPLNLLNPLLKISSTPSYLFAINQAKKMVQKAENMPKIDWTALLDLNLKNKNRTDFIAISNLYKSSIEKYTSLIEKYNINHYVPISPRKFLKTITSNKLEEGFQQNILFNFNPQNNNKIQLLTSSRPARRGTGNIVFVLLEYAFRAMSCLISKPIFMDTHNKLTINLFYYIIPGKKFENKTNKLRKSIPLATSINGIEIPAYDSNTKANLDPAIFTPKTIAHLGLSSAKKGPLSKIGGWAKPSKWILSTPSNILRLNKLTAILSKIFNKPIELDLTRLHFPFFDDHILVKTIGIMSKTVPVRNIIKYIFSKTIIYSKRVNNRKKSGSVLPSFLSGINIKIGGRLMTQRVIPRLSTRIIQRGAICRGKVNYVDWSRINLKNKRGAYSITVTMSHIF